MHISTLTRPCAIAMWDFSWLERRWEGSGYEDWARALDGLVERGYTAVRIDAFPHLLSQEVAAGVDREWDLLPVWNQHDWGAPGPVRIASPRRSLVEFIGLCRDRGVDVGLSTWYRQDTADSRMRLVEPRIQAGQWAAVLDVVVAEGLADSILYVDLTNEIPLPTYSPFLYANWNSTGIESRATPRMRDWITAAILAVRERHPGFDYCFSYAGEFMNPAGQDVSTFDLLELHIWMCSPEFSDFHQRIGYDLGASRFDPAGYPAMQRAEAEYRQAPGHWRGFLEAAIDAAATWSQTTGLPLVTTECWGPINYRDWPMLDWGWVKEVCEHGVGRALMTGRWKALATSNFCGPQFRGMWRDIDWHRRLTTAIKCAPLADFTQVGAR